MKLLSILSTAFFIAAVAATPCPAGSATECCAGLPLHLQFGGVQFDIASIEIIVTFRLKEIYLLYCSQVSISLTLNIDLTERIKTAINLLIRVLSTLAAGVLARIPWLC
ncbi:hypothetical protein M752DRAFT_267571 [Aspergillus phoenicis ATCC 13157]|uniref:Hydrophobin n=1 Tax=Aspergillus phoenicis ATCC 13157 TaxID=1353007 RepID=A0A370PGL1_ASPPH|nr:hypothetical protein M752DRAFT_267571 [Aspergillus phoenicis ATCC 13157]